MHRFHLRPVVVVACALALAGCQSVLKDLQTCERHYDGTVSGGTMTPAILAGKALIDCCPVGQVSTPDHTHCAPAPLPGAVIGNAPPKT